MKIYESQNVIINHTDKNDKKIIPGKNDFQSIMDHITSSSASIEKNAPADIQMSFINSAGIVIKEDAVTFKEEALNSLKETLDLVDFYAEKLGDPSHPSDGLSPLVEQLEERLEMLKEIGSNTQIDDRLSTIISDAVTSMGVEIERFKRGDYL